MIDDKFLFEDEDDEYTRIGDQDFDIDEDVELD